MSDLPVIPGTDVPVASTAEVRRKWIMRRVRLSEHAVRLLVELSLGADEADGWPPSTATPMPATQELAYA